MASSPQPERKIACNPCRRRKTACDRVRPRCSLCTKGNFDCDYSGSSRQPGLRAGYVNQLENRIVSLERRLFDVESHLRTTNDDSNHYRAADQVISDLANPAVNHSDVGMVSPDLQLMGSTPMSRRSFILEDQIRPGNVNNPETSPLSPPVVLELSEVWFRKYHPWFPILHQPSFDNSLSESAHPGNDVGIVAQAIVAATLTHSQVFDGDTAYKRGWQERLVTSIIADCIGRADLEAVQSLLILAVVQYGDGRYHKSSNILAIARRIGVHLRFGSSSLSNSPTATSPTALRRLPSFVNTSVAQEERIRAYWMIEVLESIATIGSPSSTFSRGTPGDPLLPCSDPLWSLERPEVALGERQITPYHYCSAFSLCIILAASELDLVHQFLRKPVRMGDFEQRDAWQSEAQQIDERLSAWRDEFVAAVFRLINAEKIDQRRAEMDAYIVLTNCVLNTAVITLLQARATCPRGIDQDIEPWAFANHRCVYACENTAFKIRQMDEEELLICHPHLIFSIFAAARFYLVYSKAVDANVPTNLHSLAFALHTCGKRWPLARLYEQILRIAVADYRTPIEQSRVPKEFYNLRLTTFEVSETLIAWSEGPGADMSPSLEQQTEHSGSVEFTPMLVNVLA